MTNTHSAAVRRPLPGVALVGLAAALWGTDALFRRGLALDLPAAAVVFWEHVLLAAMVAPVLWRARRVILALTRRELVALAVVGVGASATATILFTAAFRFGDPTSPLLLQKLQPVIAILAAYLLLGERLLPRFALYFVAAVSGAWLIAFADPLAVSVRSAQAAGLAVGAATLWGLGTVLGRWLAPRLGHTLLTALRFAIGLPASALLLALTAGSGGFVLPARAVPALVLLALIPGLAALLIYYRGLRDTPASSATLAELGFPLSAIVVNRIAFGTTLTPTQWAGVILLSATLVVMSLRSTRGARAVGVRVPEPGAAYAGAGSSGG